jgi:transcription elongation GreA/GreB family factor
MALPDGFEGKKRDEIEEWFLTAVEADPMPTEHMLAVLESLGSANGGDQVESWAELLQDGLAAKEDTASALKLLALRCEWSGDSPAFGTTCKQAAKAMFTSRLGKAYVKNVGFDGKLPPSESLRRLDVLARLKKGTLCHEKTWGFGTVKRVDDFYERVTIDFAGKPRHEMSMAYAAETLELIDDDHLLARLHQDPDALQALVKDDAAEVVRITLRSYGPTSALDLKDRLVPAVMQESDWKSFWDAARRALKGDPLVHIPARRSDPIALLGSEDEHVQTQFQELTDVRDPEGILKKADELETAGAFKGLTPENAALLGDRLAFAIWGAEGKHPDMVARALLMALRCGVVGDDGLLGDRKISVSRTLESLLAPDSLSAALDKLPVRAMSGLLKHAATTLPDLLAERLIPILPKLSISVITEAIPRIQQTGHEPELIAFIAELLTARKGTPSLLLWVFKNLDVAAGWVKDDPAELLRQGFEVIEWPEAGDQLRAQHQLRALFESGSWMTERMHALSHEQRVVLLNRVQACRGWDEAGRRSVVAGIIKTYPELHEAVTAAVPEEGKSRARLTSWRSYRERQVQFKALMEEDIPENAREIAVARSYGDLRENAEYKYAKEHQRILYRRRDEMEEDLKTVKGTDFAGCRTDRVGMGTTVTVRRPSGNEDRYCILGEWDRDEDLNIISSLSRLAQLLEGRAVGDRVELPASVGDEECEIVGVEGLSDSVTAWLAG